MVADQPTLNQPKKSRAAKKRRLNRINENETSTSGKKAKLDENHKERSAEQIEKDKSGAAPKESAEKGWQSQIV